MCAKTTVAMRDRTADGWVHAGQPPGEGTRDVRTVRRHPRLTGTRAPQGLRPPFRGRRSCSLDLDLLASRVSTTNVGMIILLQ